MWDEPLPEVKTNQQDESRLLAYLMQGYDREVRPVNNASNAVSVYLGITLTQIFDMVRLLLS